jgi:CO/xanthine dehydrogenase Mo-binding subunit
MCALAAYKVPNFFIEAHDVVVNKPKVAAYRAPGSPIAAFAVESVVDEIARELRIDPIELRLRNANAEGDRAPYGPKYGPIGLTQVLDAARNHPHWRAPLGANQGRGIAVGFWFNAGMNSSATVTLNGDGSAAVVTGNPDIGGTRAAQAIMVAEELGIPVDRVRSSVGDTDGSGYTDVTGGSRVCYATGMAVIRAAEDAREQLPPARRTIWNVSREGRRMATTAGRSARGHGESETDDGRRTGARDDAYGRTDCRPRIAVRADGRPAFGAHICDLEWILKPGAARSSATPCSRMSAERCIRAMSKDRCRAAPRRASDGP